MKRTILLLLTLSAGVVFIQGYRLMLLGLRTSPTNTATASGHDKGSIDALCKAGFKLEQDTNRANGAVIRVKGPVGTELTEKLVTEIGQLTFIREIDFSATDGVTDGLLAGLHPLHELRVLRLTNCELVTDNGLTVLSAFPQLTELHVALTKLTDRGLKSLVACKHLEVLCVSETQITNEGLREIARLRKLRQLELGSPIDHKGLSHLTVLPCLRELKLFGITITQKELMAIRNMKALSSIDLGLTDITNQELEMLSSWTQLKHLGIGANSGCTDAGIVKLRALSSLRSLDLSSTEVTNRGLAELTSLRDLLTLDLSHTRITDEGLSSVAKLSRLRVLVLADTPITAEGLLVLKPLTALSDVYLRGSQLTSVGLNKLQKEFPRVRFHH